MYIFTLRTNYCPFILSNLKVYHIHCTHISEFEIWSGMYTSLVCFSAFVMFSATPTITSHPSTFYSIIHSFTDSCLGLDPIMITWTLATNACVFWTSICMSMSGGGVFWPPGCLTCAICYLQSQIRSLQASFPACLLMTALQKYPLSPHTSVHWVVST